LFQFTNIHVATQVIFMTVLAGMVM
jgi:hypothetical protein